MSPLEVTVVDYESGNLRSVSRALEKAGARPRVTGDPELILQADAVVLPGVGSGDSAMRGLRSRGLVEPLRAYAASGRPFLGVCLGLQLLMDATDEGNVPCLGIVHGKTKRLPGGLKVPHMGWNQVRLTGDSPVFEGIPDNSDFYFVHSYYGEPIDEELIAGVTEYGIPFCSAIVRDSLIATQFHPEKSGALGLKIYDNFVRLAGLSI